MASWGEASESRLIGKRITRLSGKDKVTGKAKYTFDINEPGMLYGRILRSEVAHATVMGVDMSEAEALPGVKAVIPLIEVGKKVRYQGQEIAAVAAETDDIAKDAIRLIRVDLEELPHVVTEEDAMEQVLRKSEIGRVIRVSLVLGKKAILRKGLPKPLLRLRRPITRLFRHTSVWRHTGMSRNGKIIRILLFGHLRKVFLGSVTTSRSALSYLQTKSGSLRSTWAADLGANSDPV